MGKKRNRESQRKKEKTPGESYPHRTRAIRENCTRKRRKLHIDGDSPIKSNSGLERELELGLPSKSLAETSSNQMLPCCDFEFRRILKSRKWIAAIRRWPSNSILGRYDKHFQVYPWYRGTTLFYSPKGASTFSFMISKAHWIENRMEATHMIKGKEVKIRRTIMVSGIPKTVNEGEFKKFFSQFGDIIEHEVVLDSDPSWVLAYGFIIFDSDEAAAILAAKKSVDFAGVSMAISFGSFENADTFETYC